MQCRIVLPTCSNSFLIHIYTRYEFLKQEFCVITIIIYTYTDVYSPYIICSVDEVEVIYPNDGMGGVQGSPTSVHTRDSGITVESAGVWEEQLARVLKVAYSTHISIVARHSSITKKKEQIGPESMHML